MIGLPETCTLLVILYNGLVLHLDREEAGDSAENAAPAKASPTKVLVAKPRGRAVKGAAPAEAVVAEEGDKENSVSKRSKASAGTGAPVVFALSDSPLMEVMLCSMVQLWRAIRAGVASTAPAMTHTSKKIVAPSRKATSKTTTATLDDEGESDEKKQADADDQDELSQAHAYLLTSLGSGGLARLLARFSSHGTSPSTSSSASAALLLLAAELPASCVPEVARTALRDLSLIAPSAPSSSFGSLVDCVIAWKQLDQLLTLIHTSIMTALESPSTAFVATAATTTSSSSSSSAASGRGRKATSSSAAPQQQLHPLTALRYVAYLLTQPAVRGHAMLRDIVLQLGAVTTALEHWFDHTLTCFSVFSLHVVRCVLTGAILPLWMVLSLSLSLSIKSS